MKTRPSTHDMMTAGSNLLSLAQEAMDLARLIVEAGGELTPELEERLEISERSIREKADAYVAIGEQFDAQAALWKRKSDACARVAKGFERSRKGLLDRVKFVMQQMAVTEIKAKHNRFVLSKMKPKLIIDETALPPEYRMAVTELVPDKARIEAALKEGFQIPGCKFEEVVALRTYENSQE